MNTQTDIIIKAGSKFEEYTGITFNFKEHNTSFIDASVKLEFQGNTWDFDAEIKSTINEAIIGQFQQKHPQFVNIPILITSYVSPPMGDYLRAKKLNFIDAAGNAYIYAPPLIIDIHGNKPDEIKSPVNRMNRMSGLKIIFTLLCNPGFENRDYRTISKMSDVALGSVGWVMRDLKQNGYLRVLGKKHLKLTEKEELLKNWVSNYHDQLRPKIFLGRYSSINENWYQKIEMNENLLWGSEYAATIITKYLKPEVFTLYTKDLDTAFLIKNRFHNAPEGCIEILKKFWFFDDNWTNQNVVPPLLIYADLIASKSDRNIETAKIIYDKELIRLIQQN